MYSYWHRFHAGNFADVHKHITLIAILNKLKEKSTPFCVLDAFAGEGLYDLTTREAKLHKEFAQGFKPLLRGHKVPKSVQEYLNIIAHFNEGLETQRFYPGSPSFIKSLLRSGDRCIAVEGHPTAFGSLQALFKKDKSMHLHQRDAFEAIKALVPFPEKRGLVFIDPSYEVKKDYQTVFETIQQAYAKMPNAVFCVWYPILAEESHHKRLLKEAAKANLNDTWHCEWRPYPNQDSKGLIGSGILMVNKPWTLENGLTGLFIELKKTVYPGGSWYQKRMEG